MYDLPYFKETDASIVRQFVRDNPFAFLSGCDKDNKPVVTQVPVFIDENDGRTLLTGHIMRNSDHHKAFLHNPNVLAVFSSPHCYVSATWYNDPVQASTWNYISVHAKGIIRFGDEQELISILKRLTLYYENNNTSSTTIFDNLPADYTNRLMKAIVAFEVEVAGMENVFKLSQNRNEESYNNIIERLEQQDYSAQYIAAEMKKRSSKLFKKNSSNTMP